MDAPLLTFLFYLSNMRLISFCTQTICRMSMPELYCINSERRSSISIVRRLFCLSERWHSSCHLEATFSPWVQTYILPGKLTVYSCTPKSLLRQTCTLTLHIRMAHIDKYSPPGIGTESAVFLRSSSFWTRTERPHGAWCGGHNQVRWGWREKWR